jgi:hypothetical protein
MMADGSLLPRTYLRNTEFWWTINENPTSAFLENLK